MTAAHRSWDQDPVYRVDKFVVPSPALPEFMRNVRSTHELLQEQPGFLYDLLLEKTSGDGSFNIVTVVAWEGPDVLAGAGTVVRERHERSGFDPRRLFDRLGVSADLANYAEVG